MPVRAQCLGSTQQVPLLPPWPTHCFQGDGPDGVPGLRPDEGARSQALLTGHQEHPPPSLWALEWNVWCSSTRGRDTARIRCRPIRNMLRMISGDPRLPPLPCLVLTFSSDAPLSVQFCPICLRACPFLGASLFVLESYSLLPARSLPAQGLHMADHRWDSIVQHYF